MNKRIVFVSGLAVMGVLGAAVVFQNCAPLGKIQRGPSSVGSSEVTPETTTTTSMLSPSTTLGTTTTSTSSTTSTLRSSTTTTSTLVTTTSVTTTTTRTSTTTRTTTTTTTTTRPFAMLPWTPLSRFYSGITHIKGRYSFETKNFLNEGADRLVGMGIKAAFFYLNPDYDKGYPANGGTAWPSPRAANLKQLAQSAPYRDVFSKNFELILLTAYEFTAGGLFTSQSGWEDKVETEIYNLTRYLIETYRNSNKTFVIKNWEGDWHLIAPNQTNQDAPADKLDWMKRWFAARQRGVTRARNEMGEANVRVLMALEVNRVLDADRGLARLINRVAPQVDVDLITYSSYDAIFDGSSSSESALRNNFNRALQIIHSNARDPQGLGKKRILVSEYGVFENENHAVAHSRMIHSVLDVTKTYGAWGAFYWELFDNECETPAGVPMNDNQVALPVGHVDRPRNGDCRGLWIVRPDGSLHNEFLNIIKSY